MSRPAEQKHGYDDQLVARLELLWGEGFLSPGGADESRRLLQGMDVRGMDVLDIGCGTGGPDVLLSKEFGAKRVVGIDVEQHVLDLAVNRAEQEGLSEQLKFQLVEPGPLQFDPETYDVVFSKDAILHIPDKPALFADVFRVLKPGGTFIASDWLKADDRRCSRLEAFLNLIEYSATPETPLAVSRILNSIGFVDVQVRDRSKWLRDETRRDNERIFGPLKEHLVALIGREKYEAWTKIRHSLLSALEAGELRLSYILGRKRSVDSPDWSSYH